MCYVHSQLHSYIVDYTYTHAHPTACSYNQWFNIVYYGVDCSQSGWM